MNLDEFRGFHKFYSLFLEGVNSKQMASRASSSITSAPNTRPTGHPTLKLRAPSVAEEQVTPAVGKPFRLLFIAWHVNKGNTIPVYQYTFGSLDLLDGGTEPRMTV